MLNLSVDDIVKSCLSYVQNKVVDTLKESSLTQKIVAVAFVVFGCLTAIYFVYRSYCKQIGGFSSSAPIAVKPPLTLLLMPLQFSQSKFNQPPGFDDPDDDVDDDQSNLSVPTKRSDVIVNSPRQQPPSSYRPLNSSNQPMTHEEKALASLKANWLDDEAQELSRIKNAGILPPPFQPGMLLPQDAHARQKLIVMGRVLEIKKLYSPTHYVFTHGQASIVSIANQITRECVRVFQPVFHHPLRTPFRVPHTIPYSENAQDFITQHGATKTTFMDDGHHSDKMISVDAQFCNTQSMESALDFFSRNSNISFTDDQNLKNIFKSIFSNYLPNKTICEKLAEKALAIAKKRNADTKIGVLYAICIPKSIVKDDKRNFAYACHAFGRKCECYPESERIVNLEIMQDETRQVLCKGEKAGLRTQYRILTARLTEEADVRIFDVDALSEIKRIDYQNEIENLVEDLRC